jgi:hypothetical protein
MPSLQHFCEWIYTTRLSTSIRQSPYSFPAIETVHTLGITAVVGTVAVLDFRLLGWLMKREPVSRIARQVLPWTWAGFAVMFVTGLLLSIAESQTNYFNWAFRIKMVLLLLVGVNPLIFHLTIFRKINTWDVSPVTPLRAKLAAVSSLVLWAAIIVCGRLIAYVNT